MKILIILQCAYGVTAKRRKQLKNKDMWLYGLWTSHTGRRLQNMIPEGVDVEIINSTPRIGETSSDCFQPDLFYIKQHVAVIIPDVILACGKVAQTACEKLQLDYIAAPHPAWRQLSNIQIDNIREQLSSFA